MLKKMRKNVKKLAPVKFMLVTFVGAWFTMILNACGESIN